MPLEEDGLISADEIVEDIADRCWKWVADCESIEKGALPPTRENGDFELNETDSLHVSEEECEGGRFWRMTREEWGRDEISKKYVNYIFVVMDGEKVEFSLLQDIVYPIERVGPPVEDVFPPSIIGEIIDGYRCQFQNEELTTEWDNIPAGKTEDFVENNILDPSRVLPIVLLSKDAETKDTIIERIGTLAGFLAGISRVYILGGVAEGRDDSLFGMQRLYNGTIRIFWPGRTREMLADPSWDDMYSARKFEEVYNSDDDKLIQALVNKISNATSSIPASSKMVTSVRGKIAEESRKVLFEQMEAERTEALERIERSDEKVQYLTTQIDTLSTESGMNKIEISQKQDEIKELQGRNASLNHQLQKLGDELSGYKNLKMLANQAQSRDRSGDLHSDMLEFLNGWGVDDVSEPEPEKTFVNIAEAVEQAKIDFSRLTFLDSAISSAKEAKSDADPDGLYEIFRWLNNVLWKKIKDEIGRDKNKKRSRNYIHTEMKGRLGNKKYARQESTLTMDMYGSDKGPNGRLFRLKDGALIRMQPHIKLGSSVKLRVHLICVDGDSYVETVGSYVNKNGRLVHKKPQKIKAKEVLSDFPAIIIGWCGKHLENARNNG